MKSYSRFIATQFFIHIKILEMVPLYNMIFILGFIIFAPLTASFNVFVFDKRGHIAELQKPIHIDAENTPKEMRARLQKQLEDFLYKSKKEHHANDRRDKMRSQVHSANLGNKSSPVVYSNGRYILDFDNIDVRDLKAVTKKPDTGLHFDPNESLRDYYDFVNDQQPPNTIAKVCTKTMRSEKDSSYRKKNGNTESIDLDNKKKNAKRSFKRFKIVGNDKKRKNKHKNSKSSHKKTKKKRKHKSYSSENFSASKKDSFESLSAEKPKKKKDSEEESGASDDDSFYLQGNELVKLNSKNADSNAEDDGRRRLPYFMPKRFHWSPREIKHLGYFWFNGPKGKYPSAVPLS